MSKCLATAAILLATAATAAAQPAATPPDAVPPPAPPPAATATVTVSAPVAAPSVTPPAAPAAPAAAPAPQTHAWNDVSHINGQLVKVGESNEYLKTFRKTNVSTNPIGWIVGFFGVSVSHAVSNHIAIRGDVNYINPIENEGWSMVELGAGLPLYLKRTYQGPFLEPGFVVRRTSDKEYNYDGYYDSNGNYHTSSSGEVTDVDTTVGPQMLFGWHWTWDSGFNLAAAAGIGRNLSDNDDEYEESVFFNGYFRIGYAF